MGVGGLLIFGDLPASASRGEQQPVLAIFSARLRTCLYPGYIPRKELAKALRTFIAKSSKTLQAAQITISTTDNRVGCDRDKTCNSVQLHAPAWHKHRFCGCHLFHLQNSSKTRSKVHVVKHFKSTCGTKHKGTVHAKFRTV